MTSEKLILESLSVIMSQNSIILSALHSVEDGAELRAIQVEAIELGQEQARKVALKSKEMK